MPDKLSFYQGISEVTLFDDDFHKKVYGYAYTDNDFLPAVAAKLTGIGRKDIIQAYNEWFARWKAEDDKEMKSVAKWYIKECDKKFEEFQKEHQGKAVEEWKESLRSLTTEDLILLLLNNSTKEV
ncbi:hypothetical protein R2R35_14610 [Anaerocolumna sp. AGMB13020]|uniref:hypothetical protein n=1 Tax=Anaerocolumna sp. AGMB13020 TaxID=3081750 RepID=UPI0029531F68|nr:hypothetical protein [Anaerocolumna sp. AGMB13020]WOO35029.1 hypothetical protein R2R35_14610 [Anaerocolumna sp. AGMB13020]